MNQIEELRRLIQEYIDFALTLKQESMLQKMLMDKRNSDSDHPAHMKFFEDVGAWVAEFASADPDQKTLMQALELLLFSAPSQKDKMPYWYLLAVQRHAISLIPLLEDNSRNHLRVAFEKQYPPKERLPVQRDIHRLLRKESASEKKGFFSFLK